MLSTCTVAHSDHLLFHNHFTILSRILSYIMSLFIMYFELTLHICSDGLAPLHVVNLDLDSASVSWSGKLL